MFVHKFSGKETFLCGMCKKIKRCLVNSHVGAQNLSFCTAYRKYYFFPANLCTNIEYLDIHANIFDTKIDILEYAFKQWIHMNLGAKMDFRGHHAI
jgi:hypothetical protein